METVKDIVEEMADKLGVYAPIPENDHPQDCKCRICFCIWLEDRIRKAVEPEIRDEIAIALISAGNLDDVKGTGKRMFRIWLNDFWKAIKAQQN